MRRKKKSVVNKTKKKSETLEFRNAAEAERYGYIKRDKVKPYDIEKAAIVYLALFMKTQDVKLIDYKKFSSKWTTWFREDAWGCGDLIKKAFKQTVAKAGDTEESIRTYRNSVMIFPDDSLSDPEERKALRELAERKGVRVRREENHDRYVSGVRIEKKAIKKYQHRVGNVLRGENYTCTLEEEKNFLNGLPDVIDVRNEQTKIILATQDKRFDEQVKAFNHYPYWISTSDFDIWMDRFVRNCSSQRVLKAAVKLCKKLKIRNTMNEQILNEYANRKAHKSLETLGLFAQDRITIDNIKHCIRESGISEDYHEWTKEDFALFTDTFEKYRPDKYDYIRDRKPDMKDYKLWIIQKYTGKGFKELEKELKNNSKAEGK